MPTSPSTSGTRSVSVWDLERASEPVVDGAVPAPVGAADAGGRRCRRTPPLGFGCETMTAPVRAIGHAEVGDAKQSWRDFLTARLDPSWRPGEWNPQTLIFTGDPHNPRTFVYLCANPGCSNPNGVRNTLCPFCVAKSKPRSRTLTLRFHDTTPPLCVVGDDETPCGRPRYSGTGLCFTHQSRFNHANKTHTVDLVEFITAATPLEPLASCAVNGCHHQVLYSSTLLCSRHHHQYRARTETGGSRMDQRVFAAQALPLIHSHEFTLAGCSAAVAAEVLWILQERDRRGFGISILRMRNLLKSARGARSLFEATPSNEHVAKLLRVTLPLLQTQRDLFDGVDASASDRWGPDVLQRFPSIHRTRTRGLVIDWTAVGCEWFMPRQDVGPRNAARIREPATDAAITDLGLTGTREPACVHRTTPRRRGRHRSDRGLLPSTDHARRRTVCQRLLRAAAVGPQRDPRVLPGLRSHGRRPRRIRAHHRPSEGTAAAPA